MRGDGKNQKTGVRHWRVETSLHESEEGRSGKKSRVEEWGDDTEGAGEFRGSTESETWGKRGFGTAARRAEGQGAWRRCSRRCRAGGAFGDVMITMVSTSGNQTFSEGDVIHVWTGPHGALGFVGVTNG